MPDNLDAHYKMVVKAITDGRVIPFLGAGVNLCGRPPEICWEYGQSDYLPGGSELAAHLANNFDCPSHEMQVRCPKSEVRLAEKMQVHCPSCKSEVCLAEKMQVHCPSCKSEVHLEKAQDLTRVSQYVSVMMGLGPLYDELHLLFDADYLPTPVHQFFATLPAVLRAKGYPHPYQLIVTTNYDDVLEHAFKEVKGEGEARGEPFDLVCYVAEGQQRGKFLHWPPDGKARLVEKPNEYRDLSLDQRSVILKIHGAVNRTAPDAEQDSYVITEDHYIDYLTRTDISNLLPVTLAAKLRRSHILFLGYGLRDWNLRVILHRIWQERKLTWKSWAIQLNPEELDQKFWMKRDVDIFNVSLEEYIAALSERMQAWPPAGGVA